LELQLKATSQLIAQIGMTLFVCLLLADNAKSQGTSQLSQKRYSKVPDGYLMVLRQGDNVLYQLENFAEAEGIPAANFIGMGFVNITFGFFDFTTKTYNPKAFTNVELVSMHGTIAWKNDSISIHTHGVVSDHTFQAWGGHILGATVSTGSAEIIITVHDKRLQRKRDESIGADVLSLD
jgi:uncharacterized protein